MANYPDSAITTDLNKTDSTIQRDTGMQLASPGVAKKSQAVSGIIFSTFLALHLLNTLFAVSGPDAYDGVQQLFRLIYQFMPIEVIILAALILHILTGLFRIFTEPKRQLSGRARLHRYTGFFLMLVIGGHITAVRGASWFFDVYPGFAGLAFSVQALPLYFYPYYFLLGLTGFYHGLNGLGIALARLGHPFRLTNHKLKYSTGAAGLSLVAVLLGLGGWLFDIADPAQSEFGKLALQLLQNL